jgi:hypothetical protein
VLHPASTASGVHSNSLGPSAVETQTTREQGCGKHRLGALPVKGELAHTHIWSLCVCMQDDTMLECLTQKTLLPMNAASLPSKLPHGVRWIVH